jgi:hypothetical protein
MNNHDPDAAIAVPIMGAMADSSLIVLLVLSVPELSGVGCCHTSHGAHSDNVLSILDLIISRLEHPRYLWSCGSCSRRRSPTVSEQGGDRSMEFQR